MIKQILKNIACKLDLAHQPDRWPTPGSEHYTFICTRCGKHKKVKL